jgi:nitrogen regulatory protein PII
LEEITMSNDMWMVQAMIQPFKLEAVTLALAQVPGFGGMTVTDCRGFGRGKLAADARAAVEESGDHRFDDAGLIDFTGKVRLEMAVVSRGVADAVVEAIARTAHTGRPGDGKIFVWALSGAIRVRTLQTGANAL